MSAQRAISLVVLSLSSLSGFSQIRPRSYEVLGLADKSELKLSLLIGIPLLLLTIGSFFVITRKNIQEKHPWLNWAWSICLVLTIIALIPAWGYIEFGISIIIDLVIVLFILMGIFSLFKSKK